MHYEAEGNDFEDCLEGVYGGESLVDFVDVFIPVSYLIIVSVVNHCETD